MLAAMILGGMVTMSSTAMAQAKTGWTDKQKAKRLAQFAELTPEDFSENVDIDDDELEVFATINTREGHLFKGGFADRIRADTYLRALIDKKSGATIYQLYASFHYTGEWRTFTTATYLTEEGPVSSPLSVILRDVDCKYGICGYDEHVAFELPESFLRALADRADVRPVEPWRFRLKAKTGLDWTDDMAPAEAAGLLLAVDRYRAAKGIE